MGRSPCCEKEGLKKGPWTPEEDQKLLAYIEKYGHGSWRALPTKAGLQRCGKSCRLRWINYLRPDIKRGNFTLREEQTIIQLHALLGNRWSAIAAHLPKRTDNEIKNYWNTHLKKRLTKMGIDPVTHKPKTDALGSAGGNPKDAANLSHIAQWESARLEAEARLVRESKLVSNPPQKQLGSSTSTSSASLANKTPTAPLPRLQCLDILKAWQGVVTGLFSFGTDNLDSPTSTLNFLENTAIPTSTVGFNDNFVGNMNIVPDTSGSEWKSLEKSSQLQELKEKMENSMVAAMQEVTYPEDGSWFHESFRAENMIEGYNDEMMVCDSGRQNGDNLNGGYGGYGGDCDQEKYWNSIVNFVNTSPAGSTVF